MSTSLKKEKTKQEILNESLEECKASHRECLDIYKKSQALLVRITSACESAEMEMKRLQKDHVSLLKMVTEKFSHQNHVLDVTRKVTASCDDTLLNVLLAIRQNEYLQAYYPEQHGYAEMKLTGPHPAKAAGKNNRFA